MATPAPTAPDGKNNSIRDHRLRRRRKEQQFPVEKKLASELAETLEERGKYRNLLDHRGIQAQETLDRLQSVLDDTTFESSLWRHATVAIQRLSWRTGLFPSLFELRDVKKLDGDAHASGGSGEVYRGEYQGSQVCIKMLRLTQKDRKKVMKFYAHEAVLWGQLSHRNILPFYGLCTLENRPCLVSPWAENGNVMEYLTRYPHVSRLALIHDMTDGLAYLHARDIVHGDLKGANVLVDLKGRACLADFGLSSVYDCRVLDWTSQSAAASIGGTVRWQAPELLQENAQNTKLSDIYAWACTAYEIFTGETPYAGIRPSLMASYQVITQKQQGILPAQISQRNDAWADAGLDDNMWAVLVRCWDVLPEKRPDVKNTQSFIRERPAGDNSDLGSLYIFGISARSRTHGPASFFFFEFPV